MNVDPSLGKAALRLSLFIIVLAGGMLAFQPPGTAQFAITAITLLIGLLFFGLVVAVVKMFSR